MEICSFVLTGEKEPLMEANMNSLFAFHAGERAEKDPSRQKMEDQFKTRFDVNGDGVLNKVRNEMCD